MWSQVEGPVQTLWGDIYTVLWLCQGILSDLFDLPTMTPPNPKKSRTPTFSHLNPHQGKSPGACILKMLTATAAKKRKKQWLTTQKIKAAYRAEKRRMGLVKAPASPGAGEAQGRAEMDNETAKDDDSSDEEHPDRSSAGASPSPQPLVTASGRAREARPGAASKRNEKDNTPAQPTPSLREMARDAYSPASLHTHKSNPLRRRPPGKNSSRLQGPSSHTGDGRRGASERGPARGRGQPNMAKRMGVLLEKIKRVQE